MLDSFKSLIEGDRPEKRFKMSSVSGVFFRIFVALVGTGTVLLHVLETPGFRFSLPIEEIHIAWNLTRFLIEF